MGNINGLPAVTFPPASSAILVANVAVTVPATASSNTGFTLFFTGNWTSNSSDRARFWALSGVNIDFEFFASAAARAPVIAWTYSSPTGLLDLTLPYNTPFTYSTTFASTASGGISNWLNGAAGSNNGVTTTATGYTSNFSIGNYPFAPAAAYSFTGQMGEFLIYSNALTNSQRLQVEGYLSAKWSIPNFGVFNPFGSVTGLKAWFDTYDASYKTTGNTVTSWLNKAGGLDGSVREATTGAGTVSINQAYLNGKTSVRFPAGENYLNIGSLSFSTVHRTVFMVASVTSGQMNYLGTYYPNTVNSQFWTYTTDISISKPGIGSLSGVPASGFLNSTSITSGSTSGGIYLNGSVLNASAATFTYSTGSTTNQTLGGSVGGGSVGVVDMYELLYFDGGVTTLQREKIEGYLAWKWGLQASLPGDHPYKSAAPT